MKNSGETTEDNKDSGLLSSPLFFIHSGSYSWHGANALNRGGNGFFWLLSSANTTYSYDLYFSSNYLRSPDNDPHGVGLAVRYVKIP